MFGIIHFINGYIVVRSEQNRKMISLEISSQTQIIRKHCTVHTTSIIGFLLLEKGFFLFIFIISFHNLNVSGITALYFIFHIADCETLKLHWSVGETENGERILTIRPMGLFLIILLLKINESNWIKWNRGRLSVDVNKIFIIFTETLGIRKRMYPLLLHVY